LADSPSPPPPGAPAHCANCDAWVTGAFCSACGQGAREGGRSFAAQVHELLGSFFAFDGRVWRSFVPLFFRPGALTRAWIEGKRASFVPPLRLFLFFSILLFLVIQCKTPTTGLLMPDEAPAAGAPPGLVIVDSDPDQDFNLELGLPNFWPFTKLQAALAEQEQMLAKLPPEARRYVLVRRAMELAPIGLLMLVPLMAWFLQLWWMRTGSFYLDHLVFLMHGYAFLCGLTVLLAVLPLPDWARVLTPCAAVPVYFHLAMRRVYQRGFWRSLAGAVFGGILTLAAVMLVFMALVPYALLTV